MHRYSLNSLLLVLILFTSCREYQDIEFKQIRDLKVRGIEDGSLIIDGFAEFHNPNRMGIKLRDAEVEVFVKGKKVAELNSSEKVRIRPNGKFEIPLDAKIDMKGSGFVGNVLSLLTKKELELEFKGQIEVSRWLIPKKIPIHDTQKVRF